MFFTRTNAVFLPALLSHMKRISQLSKSVVQNATLGSMELVTLAKFQSMWRRQSPRRWNGKVVMIGQKPVLWGRLVISFVKLVPCATSASQNLVISTKYMYPVAYIFPTEFHEIIYLCIPSSCNTPQTLTFSIPPQVPIFASCICFALALYYCVACVDVVARILRYYLHSRFVFVYRDL